MLSVCRAAERPGPAGCRARVLHAASPSVSGLFSELLLLLFVPQVASMPRPRLAVNSEAKKGETQNPGCTFPKPMHAEASVSESSGH